MAELRPATTTTAFCYNCHRYLLRPATGFVTSVHYANVATCNGELQPAKTVTFVFCCNRVSILLRQTTKNATTGNSICWNQSITSKAELHPWRARAARAGSIHGERGRRSCIHGKRRAAELHPWRARIWGKRGRPARTPTGDEERRGGASSSAVFSHGMALVSAALGGSRQRFCERKKGAGRIVFYLDLTVSAI